MINLKNKTVTIIIALLLIITIAIPLSAISAAVPIHHKATHAYVGATPNPIGVGQETLIHLGITDELQDVQYGWVGLTVTVTRPDNTTTTLGPFRTDATGGTGTVFVPEQIGTYYLQVNFPAQWFNWTTSGGANIWYEASTSDKLALIVDQTPDKFYPAQPLPTEYWTRPIDDQLRGWYQVAGAWLDSSAGRNFGEFVENNVNAPETSHILWAKPQTGGGLVGDPFGTEGFENGDAYEGLWGYGSPVIIDGIVYYNNDKDGGSSGIEHTVSAVDLRTGAEIWSRALIGPNNISSSLTFGQVLSFNSYNYQGAFSYLWTTSGSTWYAFDPFSGRFEYGMTNVPSGTQIRGPNGEILIYTVDTTHGWMTLWNSTKVVSDSGSFLRNGMGSTYPVAWSAARNGGYMWNVTIPKGLPGGVNVAYLDEIIVGSDMQSRTADANILGLTGSPINLWALNVKTGQEGQLLYKKSWQPPTGNLSLTFERSSLVDNVFTIFSKELRSHFAFNMHTGEQMWGPTTPEYYLQTFGLQSNFAYGKLYVTGYGGIVYCYDAKSGNLVWNTTVVEPFGGSEVLWSNNWPTSIMFITDGKVYLANSEHSANQPLPRGGPFLALDAENGSVVFRIDGAFRQPRWAGQAGIADGIIALFNTYDNQIYGIGKGPSQTTVTASPKVSEFGDSILIEGTVNDISAGTQDSRITARFPNGVAAVSDDSMNDWMLYVYMQFQRPTNATGVDVTLSVVDSNGNYRDIGTTAADSDGSFSFNWKPDIEGKYTVYASFVGSKSYWPSYALTAFNVDPAPTPAPTAMALQSTADLYFVPAIAGLFVFVAIIGVVIILVLKKRP
jgi:hypothetical protein